MFQTILVPLDGSALAKQALPIAVCIARHSSGSLMLFRAVPVPPGSLWPTVGPLLDLSDVMVTEHEEARDYLEQVAASNELSGIKVVTDVLDGEPTSLILAITIRIDVFP